MKQSLVLALVGCLSSGCAFVPWSETGSQESDRDNPAGAVDTPDDPTDPETQDPDSTLVPPNASHGSPFFADTGDEETTPTPEAEPGADLPLDGEFVSLAVGQLDSVAVDSVYDQEEGEDVCGDNGYLRIGRSDGMGNSLVIEAWAREDRVDFAVHLEQLKRVDGHWERLVAYVGPQFLDTEYSVDLRVQEENRGDAVINITRAIGIGPTSNGWVEGDLFVRLRGGCVGDTD